MNTLSKEIADLCANVICLHDRLNVAEKHIGKAETFRAIKALAISSVIDAITQQITMLSLLGYEFKDMRAEVAKAQQDAAQAVLEAKQDPIKSVTEDPSAGICNPSDFMSIDADDLDYGEIIWREGEPWLVKSVEYNGLSGDEYRVDLDLVNLIGKRDERKLALTEKDKVLRWKAHD